MTDEVKVRVDVRVHEGIFTWRAQIDGTMYSGSAWKWRRNARELAIRKACAVMKQRERWRKVNRRRVQAAPVESRVLDLPK
jgi:hypothetical protein